MGAGPVWSRLKVVAMVFAAAVALVLAWLAHVAIEGAFEPAARAAGAITPALQRFISVTSMAAYTAQVAVCASLLSAGIWFARWIQRRGSR